MPRQEKAPMFGKDLKVTVNLPQEVVDQIEVFHQQEIEKARKMGVSWNEYVYRHMKFK